MEISKNKAIKFLTDSKSISRFFKKVIIEWVMLVGLGEVWKVTKLLAKALGLFADIESLRC